MTQQRTRVWTLLGAACLALSFGACGGGSAPVVGGGIGGTGKVGIKFGGVRVGGGVAVGGTVFTTAGAVVRLGGQVVLPADLRDGHVALVEGVINGATGVADAITVEEVIKGTLAGRPSANVLMVQGQQVEVDERTVYGLGIAPSSADGLSAGDLLEVWGFVKGPGLVRATRIEREDSLSEIRIVGVARNVDAVIDTFSIGTQDIDHSTADVSRLPEADPKDDDLVRVRGAPILDGGGRVTASRIEPIGVVDQPDNAETEVEGFVTAVFPGLGFRLGAAKVQTTAATEYVGGEEADILLRVEIEAEGALVGGVLVARKVKFKGSVRLEGDVAALAGDLLAIKGLPGLVVRIDGLTAFDGNATSLVDLLVGDHVEIRARVAGPSTAVGVEIKETSADSTISIQGPVDDVPPPSNPVFSILGVAIDASTIGNGQFGSPNGMPLDRAGFFNLLRGGSLVRVKGDRVGAVAIWDEAKFEDE
jgi:hypothetical protein